MSDLHYSDYPDNRGRGRPPKYPLRKMKINESIFIANATTQNVYKAIYNIRAWNSITPIKFRCRMMTLKGVTGVKVMRIK